MKKKFLSGFATAAAAALMLTACGGGNGGEGGSEAGGETEELREVTVGVLSIAPSVGVAYGIENGIFEEHGFDVTYEISSAGAAMLPAVSAGQLDFGVGNPLSVTTAVDQGLDMKIVAGYSNSLEEGNDVAGVVTRADSGIETWADLEGKTTAVNALNTLGDLTVTYLAEEDGADPAKVNFSEMGFPDMPAQLERGNADAVWIPEPFLSQMLDDEENKLVGYSFQETDPGMATMVTFTSGQLAEEDPEMVADFGEAMKAALAASQEDQEGSRELLVEFLEIPEEAAQELVMERLDGEVNREQLMFMVELADKYNFIDEAPTEEELFLK
ncbi:ABC transporter substrate-binding protein [Enteractinococcus coprophilus]|uniref:NitT/TauT family transport system substrate-binding protein n=1 Tax=Enteractinococcus coprophilus TaxID=1027633 RepID=A0A543AN42_9MICC|nr:ABC transporter substrate-binding protein [Enteractinococcus coprophilus]TQL73979.1 NitT/TauT family transport system substrate-binding protein [Enteractinococcus coprophilus]